MSEARNEAERIWPDSQALQQPSLDDMYGAWSRDAFVRGAEWQSQREPAEAEIEAAARVFFGNLHYPSASLDWDKASDQVKDNWRRKTRLALTATRKAVAA
jgi:hypothetical protein